MGAGDGSGAYTGWCSVIGAETFINLHNHSLQKRTFSRAIDLYVAL